MVRVAWVGLLLIAACAKPAEQPFDAAAQGAVRDSAIATLNAYVDAIKSLDSARIAAFYADDPAFRMVDGQHSMQRSELLAVIGSIAQSLTSFDGWFVTDSLTVIPLTPTHAIAAGPYVDVMTDTAGVTAVVRGYVTWHLRRGAAGWQFLYGHAAPLPPETQAP